jgi:hypothetical protein
MFRLLAGALREERQGDRPLSIGSREERRSDTLTLLNHLVRRREADGG